MNIALWIIQALLAAVPGAAAARGALAALGGSVPNLLRPPPGCRFAPRCAHATPRCDAGRTWVVRNPLIAGNLPSS